MAQFKIEYNKKSTLFFRKEKATVPKRNNLHAYGKL